jgi:hypothetical protein
MKMRSASATKPDRAWLFWEIISAGALAALFVRLAYVSWRTWPDLLVDFGHELYVPWRLSQGDVLYRDIAFSMGPLSQYGNALLFKLFGVSLGTLIWANLVLLAAILAMVIWLFRQCGTRTSSTLVGMFFLAVFAFSQYSQIGNYNFVCPYRHEMTHGLALGLANLICLTRFGQTRHVRWLIGSGLCLGLVALTKVELVLPAVMTTVAAVWVFAWRGERIAAKSAGLPAAPSRAPHPSAARKLVASLGIVVATTLCPVVMALCGLAMSLGWHAALKGLVVNYVLAFDPSTTASSAFYRSLSGLESPVENVMNIVLWTAALLGASLTGILLQRVFVRCSKAWIATATVAAVAFGILVVPSDIWFSLPSALPVLLPVVIAVHIGPTIREGSVVARSGPLLWMAIYGVGLLPKILLRTQIAHYGFVLAMPGTLVLAHVAIHAIPAWLERRVGSGACFRALAAGLLTACGVMLVAQWERVDKQKTLLVGQAGDRFYADPNNDERTWPAVRTFNYLAESMQSDETLVVIPDGVMLNYLLRKRNPTPFLMFNPWEFDVHGGEEKIGESLIRSAPDYIVVMTMDMTIFGRGNFGEPGYGDRISSLIAQHYEVVDGHEMLNPFNSQEFGALVYKRRR